MRTEAQRLDPGPGQVADHLDPPANLDPGMESVFLFAYFHWANGDDDSMGDCSAPKEPADCYSSRQAFGPEGEASRGAFDLPCDPLRIDRVLTWACL